MILRYWATTFLKVLHQQVNANLVRIMNELNGCPYAVSGKNVLRAERITTSDPETGAEQDWGFVGRVANVDTQQLRWLMDRGQVPVLTPLGADMDGQAFNINADMAACEVAAELQAHKLVFLSDVPGILRDADDEQSLISTVYGHQVESLISDGIIAGGMVPKVLSMLKALEAGTRKVHLIDGRIQHSLLLEIFTRQGIGTQIVADTEKMQRLA